MSRYDNRIVASNRELAYSDVFRERGVNFINQYTTPQFYDLTASQRASLIRIPDVWKLGDRLWKYASIHYGDPRLWWVIGWYNMKPTDSHFQLGDPILIPVPVSKVLTMFDGVR
jgi:hypothetical protein